MMTKNFALLFMFDKTLNYHSFYFRHQHSPLTRCVPPARIKNLTADIARPTAHCQIPVIHIHNEHGLHPRHSRHYQLELQVCTLGISPNFRSQWRVA